MALMSTKEHLKYVKSRTCQLKSTDGKAMTFCLLKRKGSKDILVHFDKESQAAKYKSPTSIHQILKKTAAFNFDADPGFFSDPSKLVSMTGVVTNKGGKLNFAKQRGKSTDKDLKLGLKLIKIKEKDCTFDASVAAVAPEAPRSDEMTRQIGALAVRSDLDRGAILEDPGRFFGSFDEMIEVMEALRGTTNRLERMLLNTLKSAYNSLSEWSDEGIEAVSDAFDLIGDVDDFSAELKDLEDAETLTLEAVMAELAEVRTETAELLRKKDWWEHLGKDLQHLKSGHFKLAVTTTEEVGGDPLMLVSSSSAFDAEQQAQLESVCRGGVMSGEFKKSKSGKKIAIISDDLRATRTTFRKVFAALGMVVDPYIVTSFDELQTQLQTLKQEAAEEDLLESCRSIGGGAVRKMKVKAILQDPVLSDALVRFAAEDSNLENVAGLIVMSGATPPASLDAGYVVSGKQAIYETYIAVGSTYTINIADRRVYIEQAEAGAYEAMDFTDAINDLTGLINKDPLSRFAEHDILATTIADSDELQARFSIS